jgi:predicted CDP-diglyceride synthetase/phosphatidate cytidylyltransferase
MEYKKFYFHRKSRLVFFSRVTIFVNFFIFLILPSFLLKSNIVDSLKFLLQSGTLFFSSNVTFLASSHFSLFCFVSLKSNKNPNINIIFQASSTDAFRQFNVPHFIPIIIIIISTHPHPLHRKIAKC